MVFPNKSGTRNLDAVRVLRHYQKTFVASLSLTLLLQSQIVSFQPALAAANQDDAPTGTLLIPMTPKLDSAAKAPVKQQTPQTPQADSSAGAVSAKSQAAASPPEGSDGSPVLSATVDDDVSTKPAAPKKKLSAGEEAMAKVEKGTIEEDTGNAQEEDTTLKGTVQIIADDTEFDQEKNTFLGSGNAVAIITGQDAKLEADTILYNQNTQMMDARGHVRILRAGNLTTGDAFKFKTTSDEYLITSPNTEVNGSQVIARKAIGTNAGLTFKNGNITMPDPIYIQRNSMFAPLGYRELISDKLNHPDAYLPAKPSFKFKARKMVYEKYKRDGNMTVFGGRLEAGNFSVPVPKFTMTVGGDSKITFPTTFLLGTNMQVGGTNIGPRFNREVAGGVLSWAPLVQFGGASLGNADTTQNSKVGIGGQVAYTNDYFGTHIGYGSVSNLLVSDLKFGIYKKIKFQSGINRFMSDGAMGLTRARLRAEVTDDHAITTIPFVSYLNFRSSAGWMQDDPQLLTLNPNLAKLYGSAVNRTVMNEAFRLQESISASSHNLFSVGNNRYGMKSYMQGSLTGRSYMGYGNGSSMGILQAGPVLDLYLNRLRMQTGYTQAAVRGSSPFVFDQFIQGAQYVYATGSYKFNKYLMLGGTVGYNLAQNLPYQQTVNIAFGPDDFKVVGAYDFIYGMNRFGFDVLYGQPANFKSLVMKGKADQGQIGGI
jgi:hypothetical protein